MKATGIVRRIDDLGRVVIPKEIRRTMRVPASTTTLSPIPQSPAIRFSTLKTVSAAVCMSAQPLI